MAKTIKVSEFRAKQSENLREILSGDGDFLFAANETYKKASFIVASPDFFINLARAAGREDIASYMEQELENLDKRVSEKYSKIRKSN